MHFTITLYHATVTNQMLYFHHVHVCNILAPQKQFTGDNSFGHSESHWGRECWGWWHWAWESGARKRTILQAWQVTRPLWCGREGTSLASWFDLSLHMHMQQLDWHNPASTIAGQQCCWDQGTESFSSCGLNQPHWGWGLWQWRESAWFLGDYRG
jgi:hypothetical protein